MVESKAEGNAQNQPITQGSPSPAPVQPTPAPAPERTFAQSEVNEIVGRAKQEAQERTRRELEAQYKTSAPAPAATPSAQPTSIGGIPQMSQEQIRQAIQEETKRMANEDARTRSINNVIAKLTSDDVKKQFPDFDQKVAVLNLPQIEDILHLAGGVENTAAVVYELAERPEKIIQLREFMRINPALGMQEMTKLANSIKKNADASKIPVSRPPLSQELPSTIGTDNGSKSISDLRKDPFYYA